MRKKVEKKTDWGKIASIIFFVLLIVTSVLLLNKILSSNEKPEKENIAEKFNITEEKLKDLLSTENFEKVIDYNLTNLPTNVEVTLKTKCYELVGYIDFSQAESIRIALNESKRVRPTAHDLIKNIFDNLGIELVMVKIVGISGNNYLGLIVVKQNNTFVALDSRPSDGIALALRFNSSIYISKDLLASRGKYIC